MFSFNKTEVDKEFPQFSLTLTYKLNILSMF